MARSEFITPTSFVQGSAAGIDEPDTRPDGFLQRPFVQNVVPLMTSVSVHAGTLIVGLLVFGAVEIVKTPPIREQIVIPDQTFVDGPAAEIPSPGPSSDPLRVSMQDVDPTALARGLFDRKGPTADFAPAGAMSADASVIDPVHLTSFATGSSLLGSGPSSGMGPMNMFGTPGGGSGANTGPSGAIICGPCGGPNARRIVFLCDATGSMINKMATLKDQLNKSVVSLRRSQSFDIVFYQDQTVEPMTPALIPATPENKRKAANYLDGVASVGTTDPIPSMIWALKIKPQIFYFLTDAADFPDTPALLDAIKKYNPDHKTRINTILFVENKAEHEKNADSEGLMKGIATDSGGNFRWVEMDELP